MFDFLLKNEEKIFSGFSMIQIQKRKFWIESFYNFFSTFAKEILVPKGMFGQKTREI